MQSGVIIGLVLFYMIVWIVIQFKIFDYIIFDPMSFFMRLIFAGLLVGIAMMYLTIYFWQIALIIFIILALIAFGKGKTAGGVALIIVAIIVAVVCRNIKSDALKNNSKDSAVTQSQSYDGSEDNDDSYDPEEIDLNDSDESDESSDQYNDTDSSNSDDDSEESDSEGDDYIFPESDSGYISKDAAEELNDSELRIAINEIYARHGYHFKSEDLQDYFDSKPWYEDQGITDQSEIASDFNVYEKKNVQILTNERSKR